MKHHFFAFLFLLIAVPAFAAHVAVLETVAGLNAKDKGKLSERQYLTNVLREEDLNNHCPPKKRITKNECEH